MRAKAGRLFGAVLVVLGAGWLLLVFAVVVSVPLDEPGESLPLMAANAAGTLLVASVGLLPACLGYGLLRSGRPTWPKTGQVAAVVLGLGWALCMGAAGITGGEVLGGSAIASPGLVLAGWAGYAGLRSARLARGAEPASEPRSPPWPSFWPWLSGTDFVRRLALLAPVGLGAVAGGVMWFASSQFLFGLFALSWGLIVLLVCFGLMPLQLATQRPGAFPARSTTREHSGQAALVLTVSPAFRWMMRLLVVLLGAMGVAGIDIWVTEGSTDPSVFSLAFAGVLSSIAVLGLVLAALVERIRAARSPWRRGPGGLMLTSSEVLYGGWRSYGSAVRWDDVAAVYPGARRDQPVVIVDASPKWLPPGFFGFLLAHQWMIKIRPMVLRCDPVLLHRTLRFYLLNPQTRSELGTQAALDRIARGDLL